MRINWPTVAVLVAFGIAIEVMIWVVVKFWG